MNDILFLTLFLLQLLAVELLNVLHRLLLTRDPPAVQLQVTAVVQEAIRAAQDHLQRQRTSQGQELAHPKGSDCCIIHATV